MWNGACAAYIMHNRSFALIVRKSISEVSLRRLFIHVQVQWDIATVTDTKQRSWFKTSKAGSCLVHEGLGLGWDGSAFIVVVYKYGRLKNQSPASAIFKSLAVDRSTQALLSVYSDIIRWTKPGASMTSYLTVRTTILLLRNVLTYVEWADK